MRMSSNAEPPGFGPGFPVYPPLDQVLRVTGLIGSGFGSGPGTPLNGPIASAVVQQFAPLLSTRDREDCYAYDPNGGTPVGGGYYLGRLVGNYLGLPLYALMTAVLDLPPFIAVTNVCDDFVILSGGQRVVSHIRVQFSYINPLTAERLSDWCVIDPPGCCAASGSGPGSGSGSGSGSGGCPTHGCYGFNAPLSMPLNLSGVANGSCTNCTQVNGIYTLHWNNSAPFGGEASCTWTCTYTQAGCNNSGTASLQFTPSGPILTMQIGAAGTSFTLVGSWNNSGLNTFTANEQDYCIGPFTAVIDSRCYASGSGSGTGGGTQLITDPCCPGGLPQTIHLTLTNINNCSCLAGTYAFTWVDQDQSWKLQTTISGCFTDDVNLSALLFCSGTNYFLQMSCGRPLVGGTGDLYYYENTSLNCSPLHVTFPNWNMSTCCGGQVIVTVTQ